MRVNIHKLVDVLILGMVALLTHQSIFLCYRGLTLGSGLGCRYGSASGQLGVLAGMVLIAFWLLRLRDEERRFFLVCRRNWLIFLFVGIGLLSLTWTAFFPATIYRSLLMLLLTLLAAYLGIRISARDLVIFIAVTIGVFALASLLLGIFLPQLAIMTNHPYEGLWRGIFWHKIYLGATMALGYIAYLVILFSPGREYVLVQKILAGILLVVCVVLAILSDSASGLVVLALQSGLFILLAAWLAWGGRMPRYAYWVLGGCAAVGLLLLLTNLGFVFGIFNRSASMTGRLPMWLHVWETYIVERPLFGYGFGAFWLQPGINEKIQSVVGWTYPVRVSDDGYLDVMLGLGIVGLFLLLAILALAFRRTLPRAIQARQLTAFFPVLVLMHVVFINISLSYIVEIESFIWFLLALILFMHSHDRFEKTSKDP